MPRGKGGLKSITETNRGSKSANTDLSECAGAEMKDVEETTAAAQEDEGGQVAKVDNKVDIGNMSVNSNTLSDKGNGGDLRPNKPKRLFVIAGSKKKDAKPKESAAKQRKVDSGQVEGETPTSKGDENLDTDSIKNDEVQPEENASTRNSYGDDEHPYEDPSVVVNNSTTPQHKLINSSTPRKPSNKSTKMKQNERPQSPAFSDFRKSTESIKAAVKAVKEKHPSVMSEHSTPRSIFAFLVAMLLALIIFLSFYFLIHCHAVLSVVLAFLMFLTIFVVLGFLDTSRMKCLILLFLPSVCSRAGKMALYVLLLYFAIEGPLCNTIGNIKSVGRSIKCVNSQHSGLSIAETFRAAQNCVETFPQNFTNSPSGEARLICLKRTCFSTKIKLERNCAKKRPEISQKVCDLTEQLSCDKSNSSEFRRNPENCPSSPCLKHFEDILELVGEDNKDNGCGFLEIIGMLLPLLILLVFNEAYSYEKNYRTYNNFHNYFLTGHFQCIDQSRSSCDREAVLPLKKVELRKHVRPATVCQLTNREKKLICTSLQTYFIFFLVVLFIILADLYTFRMFDKETDDRSQVRMVPGALSMYNDSHSLKNSTATARNETRNSTTPAGNETNNRTVRDEPSQSMNGLGGFCMVRVEPPGSISKIVIPTLLAILLIVIFLQVYVIRLQWYVCSIFNKEREKERVFYLYNKILEERIQLIENCRKRMKCYHREMKTLNFLEPTRVLARQAEWLSKIFKFFHINLRKCIVCNDSEKPAFKICHGADCSGVYCLACSFDVDKKCLYCDTDLKKSLSVKYNAAEDISSKESLV